MVELLMAPLNAGPPRLNTDLSHQMVILVWVMFVGAIFVLSKFVWQPILNALSRREIDIRSSLAQATNAKKIAAEAEQKQKQIEIDAAVRAREIEAHAVATARTFWSKLAADAEENAEAVRKEAEQGIARARQVAEEELRRNTAVLAVQMASQILQKEVSADNAQAFTDKMIDSLA